MARKPTKLEQRWAPVLPDATHAEFTVRTQVWRWKGEGGWHFATLPEKQSKQIKEQFSRRAGGWGSIKVHIKIGKTEWNTSLFPHRKSKSYLFAIKAEVRKKEGLAEGDRVTAKIVVVV